MKGKPYWPNPKDLNLKHSGGERVGSAPTYYEQQQQGEQHLRGFAWSNKAELAPRWEGQHPGHLPQCCPGHNPASGPPRPGSQTSTCTA